MPTTHVSEVLQKTTKVRRQEFVTTLQEDLLCALWVTLTDLYGNRFTSQYGEDPLQTWGAVLRDCTEADIRAGIAMLEKKFPEWPPGPIVFKHLCRPPKRENETMYKVPETNQLPHKLTDSAKQKGRDHIKNLKKVLNA